MKRISTIALSGVALTLVVAACGATPPTSARSSTAIAMSTPSSQPSEPQASPATSAAVSPGPGSTIPAATPASSAAACTDFAQNGPLRSDRFTDLQVTTTDDGDVLTFVFGRSSIGSPAGTPRGLLSIAPMPYTFAGSGEPIDMEGEHVLLLRFRHMSLANDVGQETYTGPRELTAAGPGFRQAVLFDESEGVIGWYVGYDGAGCMTLGEAGRSVTLSIDHP